MSKKGKNMFSMISACDPFKTSNRYVSEFQYTFSQKQIPEHWTLNLASSMYIQKIHNYKSKHSPLNFPGRLQKSDWGTLVPRINVENMNLLSAIRIHKADMVTTVISAKCYVEMSLTASSICTLV
jgi:hypothetical protein